MVACATSGPLSGRAGVQPGDTVVSVNGKPITTMADFVAVTQDGDLRQGTMIAKRGGQKLAFELRRKVRNQGVAPQPVPTGMTQMMAPQPAQPAMPQAGMGAQGGLGWGN